MIQVEILLATYNGARYLREQLESLQNQTYNDWILIARDDGSTDGTLEILRNFSARNPGKLRLIEDTDRGLGAKGNFARLLEHATARYVAFCDQDDVWLPNKLELSMAKMLELENHYGSQTPLLLHTDLEVVDAELARVAESYWKYQHLWPQSPSHWKRLMVQNTVTGCTALANRSLYLLARPVAIEAIMHDWWLALVASLFGRIEAIDSATVRYRQHGQNDTGAQAWGMGVVLSKLSNLAEVRQSVRDTQGQVSVVLQRYEDQMDERVRSLMAGYAGLADKPLWQRKRFIVEQGLWMNGWVRNLGLLWAI